MYNRKQHSVPYTHLTAQHVIVMPNFHRLHALRGALDLEHGAAFVPGLGAGDGAGTFWVTGVFCGAPGRTVFGIVLAFSLAI